MEQIFDRNNPSAIMVRFTFISNKSGTVSVTGGTTWKVSDNGVDTLGALGDNEVLDNVEVEAEDGSYLYTVRMVVAPGMLTVEVSFTTDHEESVNITYDDFEVSDEVRGEKTNDGAAPSSEEGPPSSSGTGKGK